MSDTPRTDALANSREPWAVFGPEYFHRLVDHARKLEREVNALHAQIRLMEGEGKSYAG